MDKGVRLRGMRAVAKFYGCSTATVQKWVNERTVPFYNIGTHRFFYSAEIDEALRDKGNDKKD